MTGPVQVLVVGFDGLEFSGEVMAELDRLREEGTARLIDVLLVQRAEDGMLHTLPFPDGAPPGLGDVAAAILGSSAVDGPEPDAPDGATWSLADAVPVGTTAAVALIEHVWATRLSEAIQRVGGRPLEETWLDRDDVSRLERLAQQR
ncbi:MAG TPA: DUF6325 family protein [Nocardioides sp.]|uniref:DUF6325 family protein n=1 Tax=Nocardioides sp. TaxID=35761 RepID=UPI002E38063C|nr:DUF6325 family protein [Nocardioides sp.]HEX5088105.1 DUF6325 family protein [Nocardioides sp.]